MSDVQARSSEHFGLSCIWAQLGRQRPKPSGSTALLCRRAISGASSACRASLYCSGVDFSVHACQRISMLCVGKQQFALLRAKANWRRMTNMQTRFRKVNNYVQDDCLSLQELAQRLGKS